jgi:hypothetical protein
MPPVWLPGGPAARPRLTTRGLRCRTATAMTAAGHPHDRLRCHHPNMATRHSNLGTVLTDLGDLSSARIHHERAVEIGQATLRRWPPSATTSTMLCSSLVVRSARAIGSSCETDRCRSRTLSRLVVPGGCGPTSHTEHGRWPIGTYDPPMITVQYKTKRTGKHIFWVGRHGPYSIRIDANRPGVYRWMITRDARSVASGVAANRDQAATDAGAALVDCHTSHGRRAHWAQTDSAHGPQRPTGPAAEPFWLPGSGIDSATTAKANRRPAIGARRDPRAET